MRLRYVSLSCAVFAIPFAFQYATGSHAKGPNLQDQYFRPHPNLKIRAPEDEPPRDPGTFTNPDDFNGQVKWQDMSSKDGTVAGSDSDKIWYLRDAINLLLSRIEPQRRNGVFWAGGSTSEDDLANIAEFIESPTRLKEKGVQFTDVVDHTDMQNMGVDPSKPNNLYWRAINRMSKALAASASGDGIAYVYLKPVNCRTIFSPPSQSPKDKDPAQNNQATNGEIWYYSELPMLMRNLNIKQIKSFHKNGRRFEEKVEWDAEKDKGTVPRDKYEDISMDATPIILPAAAGRPPLKRDEAIHRAW